MWLKTHGANKLEDTCHFDAPMWRQLQKHEDFVYDDEVPDNCTAGYAITVQLRSHQFCGCLRSRRVILFSAHREAYGDFPVNYRVSNFWVEQLMQERPELIAPRGARCDYGYLTVCRHSYSRSVHVLRRALSSHRARPYVIRLWAVIGYAWHRFFRLRG